MKIINRNILFWKKWVSIRYNNIIDFFKEFRLLLLRVASAVAFAIKLPESLSTHSSTQGQSLFIYKTKI